MKIVLIRHGKVDMSWPRRCDAPGFDRACREYDYAPVLMPSQQEMEKENGRNAVFQYRWEGCTSAP